MVVGTWIAAGCPHAPAVIAPDNCHNAVRLKQRFLLIPDDRKDRQRFDRGSGIKNIGMRIDIRRPPPGLDRRCPDTRVGTDVNRAGIGNA